MRIDKFLSQLKYVSRHDVVNFLKEHEVIYCEERIHSQRTQVDPNANPIYLDGIPIYFKENIYLKLYKPKGYLSANTDPIHPCAIDLIKEPYRRFELSIAGRLDIDSEGLLILSNHGSIIHQIISPRSHLPKVYEVELDRPFKSNQALIDGVTVLDGKDEPYLAKALHVETKDNFTYITIDEGKFHQVKRMFKAVGYTVTNLKRIQVGKLTLGTLKPGEYEEFILEDLF
jgi:16S rRNA pseudouridine516 synthase